MPSATLVPSLSKRPVAGTEISPAFALVGEFLPFLGTLLVTWIMSKIEKRSNSVYGLGGKRMFPNFLAGLAWGVSCLSLLVFTLWKTGLLVFDSRLLFGAEIFRYGAIWLLGFLLVGLLEEYLTRGYILFTATRGLAGIYSWIFKTRHSRALGFWTAALALSILFGLGHGKNPGESPIGLLSAGPRQPHLLSQPLALPGHSGGPSASTPRGTGPSLSFTVSLTAESWCSTISSPRILSGSHS